MKFFINFDSVYPNMAKTKINRKIEVPNQLIRELLTDSEWRMVKQRIIIIQLLEEGLSIRAVAKQAQVGTDTVVRISKMLNQNPKIREFLKSQSTIASSKWVFGKSSG